MQDSSLAGQSMRSRSEIQLKSGTSKGWAYGINNCPSRFSKRYAQPLIKLSSFTCHSCNNPTVMKLSMHACWENCGLLPSGNPWQTQKIPLFSWLLNVEASNRNDDPAGTGAIMWRSINSDLMGFTYKMKKISAQTDTTLDCFIFLFFVTMCN